MVKPAAKASKKRAASAEKNTTRRNASRVKPARLDAVDMLINQHREASSVLDKAIATEDPKSRAKLFAQVADALLMHMRIEEEIFYPMLEREGRSKKPLIDHAENEHHEAKMVIADLLALDAGDAQFLLKLRQLTAAIKHHIDEEEREILPAAEKEMDECPPQEDRRGDARAYGRAPEASEAARTGSAGHRQGQGPQRVSLPTEPLLQLPPCILPLSLTLVAPWYPTQEWLCFHDLERVYDLANHFECRQRLCVRYD
jgi:hemerythrin-like domain-containing protein